MWKLKSNFTQNSLESEWIGLVSLIFFHVLSFTKPPLTNIGNVLKGFNIERKV